MKRKTIDSSMERQFLIGLITSKPFLASAIPILKPDTIREPHFRQIAKWCFSYFHQYNEAPGASIEAMFHSWQEKSQPSESEADPIADLLGGLSEEYDKGSELNVPFMLDELGSYISLMSLRQANDNLTAALAEGDVQAGLNAVTNVIRADLGQDSGIDPINDRAVWTRAFAEPPESLIKYTGDAGRFLNVGLTRDGLVGILAPEKRGKTFWCIEFAIKALRDRRKVAFFQVGDLTESQFIRRLGIRLAGLPLWASQCGMIPVPQSIKVVKDADGKEEASVQHFLRSCSQPINLRESRRACRKFLRQCGISKDNTHFMISVHANSSVNVRDIDSILERWQHQRNFIPDVIIIDYADILAPENSKIEPRHQVNDTWKALRRLSQERRALVIAPTQADAASYGVKTIGMKNFSEDKRKYAHVTGMLGLNQTDSEKERGIMRLNWILLRESDFVSSRCLYVAQCLPLGRAFCCAALA